MLLPEPFFFFLFSSFFSFCFSHFYFHFLLFQQDTAAFNNILQTYSILQPRTKPSYLQLEA